MGLPCGGTAQSKGHWKTGFPLLFFLFASELGMQDAKLGVFFSASNCNMHHSGIFLVETRKLIVWCGVVWCGAGTCLP